MFSFFKHRKIIHRTAKLHYNTLMAQARQEKLYLDYDVKDSVYGRFEMIVLHMALFTIAMEQKKERDNAAELRWVFKLPQKIFDITFKDMDRAFRELGVGDLGVPKKMKKYMQSFNGRVITYREHLMEGKEDRMKEAVKRNIYADDPNVTDENIEKMTRYIVRLHMAHDALSVNDVAAGKIGSVKP